VLTQEVEQRHPRLDCQLVSRAVHHQAYLDEQLRALIHRNSEGTQDTCRGIHKHARSTRGIGTRRSGKNYPPFFPVASQVSAAGACTFFAIESPTVTERIGAHRVAIPFSQLTADTKKVVAETLRKLPEFKYVA